MNYLLLIYQNEEEVALPSSSEEVLPTRGRLLAGASLQAASAVTTVRVQPEGITLTNGPALSATEQLYAFYFIEAHDLNDAIQVAAQLPRAQHGSVEVRPVVAG